jgi:hypothetical protein
LQTGLTSDRLSTETVDISVGKRTLNGVNARPAAARPGVMLF